MFDEEPATVSTRKKRVRRDGSKSTSKLRTIGKDLAAVLTDVELDYEKLGGRVAKAIDRFRAAGILEASCDMLSRSQSTSVEDLEAMQEDGWPVTIPQWKRDGLFGPAKTNAPFEIKKASTK